MVNKQVISCKYIVISWQQTRNKDGNGEQQDDFSKYPAALTENSTSGNPLCLLFCHLALVGITVYFVFLFLFLFLIFFSHSGVQE